MRAKLSPILSRLPMLGAFDRETAPDRHPWWLVTTGILVPVLLILATWQITLLTGGTHRAFPHLGYFPVLLGAMLFGWPGGLATGILMGLILGLATPVDTALGTVQPTVTWLFRMTCLSGVGVIAGAMVGYLTAYHRHLTRMACHDPITGLPNGSMFFQDLERMIASRNGERPVACLIIDHPTYEDVLLTLGPMQCYELASRLPPLLSGQLPADVPLYHLRGARFGVCLPDRDLPAAEQVARQLVNASTRSVEISAIPISVHGHCGVAVTGEDARDADTVARQASAALEQADKRGLETATYESVRSTREPHALTILGDLRRALREGGELSLAYQPKIALADGHCIGMEALIRWNHPLIGPLSPDRFIPLVEKTALIHDVTRWVLRTAIGQCAQWQSQGLNLGIAVNISARDLDCPDLSCFIHDLLARHGLTPDRLELELTETAVMTDTEDSLAILDSLRGLGLQIAIDDFGKGYSSLERMRRLPVSSIKIDKDFVQHVPEDINDVHILQGTIALAHNLGLRVVAEGVETVQAHDLLRTLGCDIAQGYYISRPMPAADVPAWMAKAAVPA